MVDLTLRTLTADDAAAFWALRLRGFQEEPESFGSSYEEAERRPLSDVARELRKEGLSPDDFVLGAFGPRLIGIAGFRRERRLKRAHRGELWGMHVAREYRGQGVGKRIVAGLIDRVRRLTGVQQILLSVMANNSGAVKLYQGAGFVTYGRAPQAMRLNERYFDEELMRLVL